jgi:hypothetical protein
VVIELSKYEFETLREDQAYVLYRGRSDGELPTILAVGPVSEYPVPGSLERLEHEYSVRDQLDSDWALRHSRSFITRDGRCWYSKTQAANPLIGLLASGWNCGDFYVWGLAYRLRSVSCTSEGLFTRISSRPTFYSTLRPATPG